MHTCPVPWGLPYHAAWRGGGKTQRAAIEIIACLSNLYRCVPAEKHHAVRMPAGGQQGNACNSWLPKAIEVFFSIAMKCLQDLQINSRARHNTRFADFDQGHAWHSHHRPANGRFASDTRLRATIGKPQAAGGQAEPGTSGQATTVEGCASGSRGLFKVLFMETVAWQKP